MTLSGTGMWRDKMLRCKRGNAVRQRAIKEKGRDKGVKIKEGGKEMERKGEAACWL